MLNTVPDFLRYIGCGASHCPLSSGCWSLSFLERLCYHQEAIDVKCWLETCHSSGILDGCGLTTGWAGEGELALLVSHDQRHQALAAEDVVALE